MTPEDFLSARTGIVNGPMVKVNLNLHRSRVTDTVRLKIWNILGTTIIDPTSVVIEDLLIDEPWIIKDKPWIIM